MIVPFTLHMSHLRKPAGFGVWKQPTGKKRCQVHTVPTWRQCFRQAGHEGEHGWDMFGRTPR